MSERPVVTASLGDNTTIVRKRSTSWGAAQAAPLVSAKLTGSIDDPWMRALVLAPNARRFMSVSQFGAADNTRLAPMMQKPDSSVMMTFSADPHLGMTDDRFDGEAVVFVSTVTFVSQRTAMVR
jgi:hypothetical protein